MAAAYVCIQRRRIIRRARILRDYDNPLDYLDDGSIVSKDRLIHLLIHNLCATLQNDLQWTTMRSRVLPVSLQKMVALYAYSKWQLSINVANIQYISRQIVGNAIIDVTNCLIEISKHHITLSVDVTELNKILKKTTILWNCSFSKHCWSNWLHTHSTKSTFMNIYSSFEKIIIPWTFNVYAIRIWNFLILGRSGLLCYIKCALLTKFLNLRDAILQIMITYELNAISAISMTE